MKLVRKNTLSVDGKVYIHGLYDKPRVCPYCGIGIDAVPVKAEHFPYDTNNDAVVVVMRCTDCDKKFIVVYVKGRYNQYDFKTIIPISERDDMPEVLERVSKRFVEIHKQAFHSESVGDTIVAAIGYRTALEILIKDFAINILEKDETEVRKFSLADSIEKYMPAEYKNAADVVRIIGNDYTHYINRHNDVDFDTFKKYYVGVMNYVSFQYDMKNPPVHR